MINIAVEGESDEEAAKAVARAAGHSINIVRAARGKSRLDLLISKYNAAATQQPWVVFRDSDGMCPVDLRAELAGRMEWHPQFRLRIAHTMTEAWLLADRESFAEYFALPLSRIPAQPEALPHAKRAVLSLCATSRSRAIRHDMVVDGDRVGPLYVSRINEFASTSWNVSAATGSSDSLRRAVESIREIPSTA